MLSLINRTKPQHPTTKQNKATMVDEHTQSSSTMLSVLNGPYRGVFLREYVTNFLQKNDIAIITKESPGILECFLNFVFREIVEQKVLEQNVIPIVEIARVENNLEILPPISVPILNVDELGNMCVDLGGGCGEIPIDVDYDDVCTNSDDCGVDAIFEKTILKAFVAMPTISEVPSMGRSYLMSQSQPPIAMCELEHYMIDGEQSRPISNQSRYRNICEIDYRTPQLLTASEEHEFVCKRIVKNFLDDKFPGNLKTLRRLRLNNGQAIFYASTFCTKRF